MGDPGKGESPPATAGGAVTVANAHPVLELRSIRKNYGRHVAVDDVSFAIQRGVFVSLLGPSGSGKTTILRLIAGFEEPAVGTIRLDGKLVSNRPPFERNVTTVFQHYALFPHMNVFDNVAFGLRCRGLTREPIGQKVKEMLELVRLGEHEHRSVRNLSGGEQQRVALARALITSPSLLLLDEPLGALDLKLRREMGAELRALHRRINMTFLYVTHDQEEALSLSDEIVVIHKGRIRQHGTPDELYWRPRTPFVADFIGEANVLNGSVLSTEGGLAQVRWEDNTLRLTPDRIGRSGDNVQLALRAERIRIGEEALARLNHFSATIEQFRFYGGQNEIVVRVAGGGLLRVRRAADLAAVDPRPGETVTVGWDPLDCTVLESQ